MASPDPNRNHDHDRSDGDDPMIQLNDAISQAFPQGNEWAAQALETLSDELEPTTLVHGVVEGWMRRGTGADAVLVDTLFILTSDRLGLGRTDEEPGERHWVTLSDIVGVDAVDDSPLPLQTIEIEQNDGLVLCVGWPDSFTEQLIPVLIALAEGAGLDDAAAMPAELSDPSSPVDASDLESLEPSGWVESDVPVDPPVLDVQADGDTSIADDSPVADEVDDAPEQPRTVKAALDFFNPAPPADPTPDPDLESADGPLDPGLDHSQWTSLDARHDREPLSPGAFEPPAPVDPFAVDTTGAVPVTATGPAASPEAFDPNGLGEWMREQEAPAEPERPAASGTPPWQDPGMVWSEPLRGVIYLGGHPGHPRKRKNGTMQFSPDGLEVTGTGFQSWDMSMDWAFVHSLDIQGPDEIMFGDHLKIDSTSSALIVKMVDDTRMFFEIRTRRPPSLRAALAPVLLMVENIRTFRAGN